MLIAIEGLDGAGKTTLLQGLVEHYRTRQVPVITLVHPWSTKIDRTPELAPLQSALSGFFHKAMTIDDPIELSKLVFFLFDRYSQMRRLELPLPLDRPDYLVLLDRYIDSTSAYQGAKLSKIDGDIQRWVLMLDHLQQQLLPPPHATIYLDAWLEGLHRKPRDGDEQLQGDRELEARRILKAYDLLYRHRDPARHVPTVCVTAQHRAPDAVQRDAIRYIEHLRCPS